VRKSVETTSLSHARNNSAASRCIVLLMAIYMYIEPFSSRVTAEIEQRIVASYQSQPATGAADSRAAAAMALARMSVIKAKLT
jgi:hypothetical protein